MNKLRNVVNKYPVLSAIVIMFIAVPLTEIPLQDWFSFGLDQQGASYLTGLLEQGGVSLLMVLLMRQLGMLAEGGFTHPRVWKALWLSWPMLVYCVINGGTSPFDGTLTLDTSRPGILVLFVLLYASVGFIEEILFRGIILPLMLRKWGGTRRGIYMAVLLSSSIFGLLHLINLFAGRRTLLSTVSQIVYGIFFGVYFAAVLLRNRSIWPVIFTHALFDLCGNFEAVSVGGTFGLVKEATLNNALVSALVCLPLLLYGLFILRKVRPEDLWTVQPDRNAFTENSAPQPSM